MEPRLRRAKSRPAFVLRRDPTREKVAAQMQVTEVGHLGHYHRQVSDQVVVEVQNMEASELGEFRQERAVENVLERLRSRNPEIAEISGGISG
ncbi:hypothetical protein M0R45_020117 [Rubus argutus]|uniref:Uncharacterized protein n=1 Tax=Rubus argutus TaxID=59490 RepID=A0AAW1X7C6_RUBAR